MLVRLRIWWGKPRVGSSPIARTILLGELRASHDLAARVIVPLAVPFGPSLMSEKGFLASYFR